MIHSGPICTVVIPFKSDSPTTANLETNITNILQMSDFLDLVVVIDHHIGMSTENNIKRIKEVCPTKYIRIETCGSVGAARNLGLSSVKTPWVIFCDADDLIHTDSLVEIINDGNKRGTDLLIGRFSTVNPKNNSGKSQISRVLELKNDQHLFAQEVGIWRFVFRTSIAAQILFQDINMGEDQVFLIQYLSQSREILTFEKVIYTYYCGVVGSLTSQKKIVRTIHSAIPFALKSIDQNKVTWIHLREALAINLLTSGIRHGKSDEKFMAFLGIVRFTFQLKRSLPRTLLLTRKLLTYV